MSFQGQVIILSVWRVHAETKFQNGSASTSQWEVKDSADIKVYTKGFPPAILRTEDINYRLY